MNEPVINRNHKDSLFKLIFREKEEILSLYNAINGSCYEDPEALIIYTLEDALYVGMKNDVAFLIDDYLSLYEAQSTWNPNMPLRGASYLIRSLEQYIAIHHLDIYSGALLKLPTPRYIVLYNGMSKREDRTLLKLSDSFLKQEDSFFSLECIATVLNINYGCNPDIMNACHKLYEYSYLINEIRLRLIAGLKLEAAVDRAIDNCLKHDILTELLRKERTKVRNTVLFEYDQALHINNEKNISYKKGWEEGQREERQKYEQERQQHEQERQQHEQERQQHEQERQQHEQERQQHEQERQQHEQERQQHEQERQQHEQERQQFQKVQKTLILLLIKEGLSDAEILQQTSCEQSLLDSLRQDL